MGYLKFSYEMEQSACLRSRSISEIFTSRVKNFLASMGCSSHNKMAKASGRILEAVKLLEVTKLTPIVSNLSTRLRISGEVRDLNCPAFMPSSVFV